MALATHPIQVVAWDTDYEERQALAKRLKEALSRVSGDHYVADVGIALGRRGGSGKCIVVVSREPPSIDTLPRPTSKVRCERRRLTEWVLETAFISQLQELASVTHTALSGVTSDKDDERQRGAKADAAGSAAKRDQIPSIPSKKWS